jgi:uncharacterized protein
LFGRTGLNLLLFALAAFAVLGVLALSFAGYRVAQNYAHPRTAARVPGDTPARLGVAFEQIDLLTEDGVRLSAWYTPPQNGVVILSAHGYPGHRSSTFHALFAARGYGVISWDARALGESAGEASSLGYHEVLDVKAALDYALSEAGPGVRVGAFGISMGAATVIRAAAVYPEIEAVAADSAFASLDEIFTQTIPYPILRPFVRFFAQRETGASIRAVSPLDEIGQISPRPVFLLQGERDQVVPPDSARRLYEQAGEPRRLWTEPGISHVGLYFAMPQEYERRVVGFFDEYLR